jgi:DNA-binding MarR family transcriptional regulator
MQSNSIEGSQHLKGCNHYAQTVSPTTKAARAAVESDVLLQASKVFSAAVAHSLAMVDDEVSAPGLRVLVMLEAAGAMNLSAVAEGLGVNASTASRTCDRLVVDGLVDRREQPGDRRQISLSLTSRGAAFVNSVMQERLVVLARVVDSMPRDARQCLVDGLSGFVAAASRLGDGAGSPDGHGALIRWLI